MRTRIPAICVALLVAGCGTPEAARVAPTPAARTGPPPRLVPTAEFDAALAGAAPDAARLEEAGAALAARAEALRARAAALSAPVVDPAMRPRLEQAQPR
jgi:hypothetical protein